MKLFDPLRPCHNNDPTVPLMDDGHGVIIGRLPTLYMDACRGATGAVSWSIAVHVPVRANAFAVRYATIAHSDMQMFAQRWLDDPERVLRVEFGYDFNVEKDGRAYGTRRARSVAPGAQAVGLDALFGPGLLGSGDGE